MVTEEFRILRLVPSGGRLSTDLGKVVREVDGVEAVPNQRPRCQCVHIQFVEGLLHIRHINLVCRIRQVPRRPRQPPGHRRNRHRPHLAVL